MRERERERKERRNCGVTIIRRVSTFVGERGEYQFYSVTFTLAFVLVRIFVFTCGRRVAEATQPFSQAPQKQYGCYLSAYVKLDVKRAGFSTIFCLWSAQSVHASGGRLLWVSRAMVYADQGT